MRGRAFLTVLFLLALSRDAWAGLEVTATQPWLALLGSFVGGTNVSVNSLQEWNADGDLVPVRGRRSPPKDARIIALDQEDAERAGLKGHYPNLRPLYTPFPIAASRRDAALSDPSVLPFVAQRVLIALSEWDPANYPYYQRRLAEFQARLSSSILAGQQVLRGVSVLDLSAFSGALLRAAGCKIERPDPQQAEALAKGNVKGLEGGELMVVLDSSTPKALRRALNGRPGTFFFERPPMTGDYPAFLHDQYLALWQRITLKAPTSVRRRGQ